MLTICDEATASVDLRTDLRVQTSLRAELKRRPEASLLTIAHRLDTVMDYPRAIVMAAGKVITVLVVFHCFFWFDNVNTIVNYVINYFTKFHAKTIRLWSTAHRVIFWVRSRSNRSGAESLPYLISPFLT